MKIKKVLPLLMLFLLVIACKKKSGESGAEVSNFYEFKEYISDVSSGLISRKSDVRVVLATPVEAWSNDLVLDSDLLSVYPKVTGKLIALNNRTIAFQPESEFKSDTEYVFTLNLKKIQKTEKDYEEFTFKVKTFKQDFTVMTNQLQSYSRDWQYLIGNIRTSDVMTLETAKKLIRVKQKGKALAVKFDNEPNDTQFFTFTIDSIQRFEDDSEIEISWDGTPIGIDNKEELNYKIIGKNNFQIIKAEVAEGKEQYLEINFSDPLKKNQTFDGLVTIEGVSKLRYSVDGNILKVFANKTLKGSLQVEVFQGITSLEGYKLKYPFSEQVAFEQQKPEVKLLQSGTILPTSNNLKFNFESVNLRAVDVTVYKIYKNNILQFLQENDINGQSELKRVARPIAKKTINLEKRTSSNLSKRNAFAVDLKKIINADPGAIYRIELSYKQAYSIYKCENAVAAEETIEEIDYDEEDVEDSNWDYGGYYYYNDYYDYNWRDRDNPCTASYYRNKKVSANILATNLGTTVKKGLNNSYFVAVSDIVSTQPVSNAKVAFYNYQQQLLSETATDEKGFALYDAQKPAFFAIVSKAGQSTYVKLNDGGTLSVSKYDVSGVRLKKGIKGFIYGERGVWRPGDTLFLSFMLNDKANKLPYGHPVKMELSDPYGTIIHRAIQTDGLNNLYTFIVPTDENATTGNWNAKVSVGGAIFNKSIKIETIKPNRLKIKAGFDEEIITSAKSVNGDLEVTWLHGAIAKNLKADINVKFHQQNTTFKAFPSYEFDDPARTFNSEEMTIFDGRIDGEGKATFRVDPQLSDQAPGMLKASFVTKVYENGGDFSTDVFSKTYSPYESYVGLNTPKGDRARNMLLTDKKHTFDIATVNENGKPIAVKNLEVKIYKVNRNWWWNASNANLSQYNGSTYRETVFTTKVSTKSNGKGSFQYELKYPDWGRFLVRVINPESGHATGKLIFIDWPGWAGKARKGDPSEANMLVFAADKENYNVGDQANVVFPSSAGGRALVTIENGTEVLQSRWVKTSKEHTKFNFKITPEMAPNVYISIASLQRHANTENDEPIRKYGVAGITVENPKTKLKPEISMSSVLRPEQTTSIKVSEQNGKTMTYTLAIVDEGLLDLTRFKTPDPWETFYAKQALGVKTWDIYDDVIGAYGGRINQVFSIGGDGMNAGSKNKKANRFKPVVIFKGPFTLKKGQSKTHKVTIPKYIGSVRTMVVAHDPDKESYGNAEKATPVRKPLMVLASAPRKVTPGEKVRIPVTVFAMEKKVKNVIVKLKNNSMFKVLGSSSQSVSFAKPDEKMVYFDVEVLKNGIGTFEVSASGNGEKASYEVEMDVTNPNPETTEVIDVLLEPNASQTIDFATFGVSGTNNAQIELSSLPPMDFNSRLNYLIRYPHGCAEQTTSSVFPQLFLTELFDLPADKKQRIQQHVQIGVDKLGYFQTPSGGFSYWQGGNTANDWSSSYAGHFLIEAEKKGFVLPISFKSKWIQYQKQAAKNWRFNTTSYRNGLAQAYRLYTLALAGSPDLSSMNRLRETRGITNEAKLRLAAAYALAGQKDAAKKIVNSTSLDFTPEKYNYYTYGSTNRNKAMALETFVIMKDHQKSKNLAKAIANVLSDRSYMSTQTTAYSLLAMSKYATFVGGKGVNVNYTANGKKQVSINTKKALASRDIKSIGGMNKVTIKNNKDNTIYVRILNNGILPVGKEKIEKRNLTATVSYKNKNGTLLNPNSISQGTDFVAEVTISNNGNERVKDVALSNIFPSGWEIVNTRFTDFGSFAENNADHTDIRDDRANFYFDLDKRGTKTFRVLLNASYLGNYYLPGVQCEAMYDDDYFVRTKGQWVEVVQ
ncbi:MAG: hypothetical protein HRT68_01195 [Flavobacteriaceae bacterium]|nr:hypothetical protein [Flavobacteriaceae bacterium]